ncbi:MAG: hypothetical protein IJV77_03420 [Clostridia bacterium]|nr:hypothetical protein [Clostridia bacterium]
MKKIYLEKNLFILFNVFAVLLLAVAIFFAVTVDVAIILLSVGSIILSGVSFLFLLSSRLFVFDDKMVLDAPAKKTTFQREQIVQVFVQKGFFYSQVVINLDAYVKKEFKYADEYLDFSLKNKYTCYHFCYLTKNDLQAIANCCKGRIVYGKN